MAAPTREEVTAYGATGVRLTTHYPLDLVNENRLPNIDLNKSSREAKLRSGARLVGLDVTGWTLSVYDGSGDPAVGVYIGGCIWDARRLDLVPYYPVKVSYGSSFVTIEDNTYIGREGLDDNTAFFSATSSVPCDNIVVRRNKVLHLTADAAKISNLGVGCLFEENAVLGWSAYDAPVQNWTSGMTVEVGDHLKYVNTEGLERVYRCMFAGTAPEPDGSATDHNGYEYVSNLYHQDTLQGIPQGDLTLRRNYFDVRDLRGNNAIALNRHWQSGGGLSGGVTRFEENTFDSESQPIYNWAPQGSRVEFVRNRMNLPSSQQFYSQTQEEYERIHWVDNVDLDGNPIDPQNGYISIVDPATGESGSGGLTGPVVLEGFSADHTDVESGGFTLPPLVEDGAAEDLVAIAVSCDVGDHRNMEVDGVSITPNKKYAHSSNSSLDTMDSSVLTLAPTGSSRVIAFSGGIYPRSPKAAAALFSVSNASVVMTTSEKFEGALDDTGVSGTINVNEGDLVVAVLSAETNDGLSGLAWTGLDGQGGPVPVGDDFGYAVATKAITADNTALSVGVTTTNDMHLPMLTVAVIRNS